MVITIETHDLLTNLKLIERKGREDGRKELNYLVLARDKESDELIEKNLEFLMMRYYGDIRKINPIYSPLQIRPEDRIIKGTEGAYKIWLDNGYVPLLNWGYSLDKDFNGIYHFNMKDNHIMPQATIKGYRIVEFESDSIFDQFQREKHIEKLGNVRWNIFEAANRFPAASEIGWLQSRIALEALNVIEMISRPYEESKRRA